MLLKIADTTGCARRLGVLLVDGEHEEIVDLDIMPDCRSLSPRSATVARRKA